MKTASLHTHNCVYLDYKFFPVRLILFFLTLAVVKEQHYFAELLQVNYGLSHTEGKKRISTKRVKRMNFKQLIELYFFKKYNISEINNQIFGWIVRFYQWNAFDLSTLNMAYSHSACIWSLHLSLLWMQKKKKLE